MKIKEIIERISEAIPNLPESIVLEKIIFKWNDKDLGTWDGGFDLNELIREAVVKSLREEFNKSNVEYVEIIRFILKQEIENCCESQMSTETLRVCYDSLANLKAYEDIPLLIRANGASFDANCALFKDRIFYNGYENVMSYLKSNKKIDKEIIESVEYYAEQFGYNK